MPSAFAMIRFDDLPLAGIQQESFMPLLSFGQGVNTSVVQTSVLNQKKIIEPILLEDIRGRSLNEAFVIVDEAQNFLPQQIKTCLTRVGKDSKICLIGDTKQTDMEVFRRENGLVDAIHRLRALSEVGIVEFGKEDIVRNSVIAHILDRYED
jgi:phosphate starvation-inducible PhoH-like protein